MFEAGAPGLKRPQTSCRDTVDQTSPIPNDIRMDTLVYLG